MRSAIAQGTGATWRWDLAVPDLTQVECLQCVREINHNYKILGQRKHFLPLRGKRNMTNETVALSTYFSMQTTTLGFH